MTRELYDSEDKSRNDIMAAASSSGFFYPATVSSNNQTTSNTHHRHQLINQIQGFEGNPSHQNQIFSLNTNMGMIDFAKHHHHQIGTGVDETSGENLLLEGSSNSMRCASVFPCEGNERPSQGLSLSLSSSNPTSISLQSFELRQTQPDHDDHVRLAGPSSSRQGYFGKSENNIQQNQMLMMMNGYQFQIRSSKYLGPAQELLNEFCSIGTKQSDELLKQKSQKGKQQWNSVDESAGTSSRKQMSLQSLEFLELQKRKSKLLSMLEELDRRYRNYCDQMRAAVLGFEAAAGGGSAAVYTALASKAMSRHFRCLRDGIVGQIQATRKAMGEKDPVAPGTTRGETPKLRLLDQAFRQQKAYQQMSMMESHPWRPQRGLPERAVSILRAWLFEHFLHPYPSDVDKHILARQTGLSRSQVSNWFINARVRLWKPMVEEMYLEEAKEEKGNNNNIASSSHHGPSDLRENSLANQNRLISNDKKSEPNQLVRIDPESLSSIIINKNDPKPSSKPLMVLENHSDHDHHHHHQESFGSTFDHFSSCYAHQAVTYAGDSTNQGYGVGTGGVSLTLGLQQHRQGGVNVAFSPASQGSLFYNGENIEDCQQGAQYSLLDADQAQNLPYRNLMGAQLLHDMV